MKRAGSLLASWTALLVLGCVSASTAVAEEIGYIEDFALAADREEALAQLIPGTEDYYYYHSLHYQNNEQFGKVEELLAAWIKRYDYTPRVREILNRQAMLRYPQQPEKSLAYIQQQLGLQFNHQREELGKKPNLPTRLDPQRISRETLKARALSTYSNLAGFEDAALQWLIEEELSADLRRHLLQRLPRPDYDGLPEMVAADLDHRYSGGFGSLPIHGQMLQAQLDALLEIKPELLNQTNFVNTYLSKLQPNDDVDWRHNPEVYEDYLERQWAFVERLGPVHNSLKAHVLYHLLLHDRSQGKYDKERFMAYIKLPRYVEYINAKYMQLEESRKHPADLSADYQPFTLLPIVGNDEELVGSYLRHFFVKETTYDPYDEFINDVYLKHIFAEVKIVNGLGDPETWYSLLPPEKYQALKERIDIDFAYTNPRRWEAGEAVGLDLHIKNVKSLIVKVYEINTENYYRDNLREIDSDIQLDGLVANHETTYTFDEPPLRRVSRHFDFPMIKGSGVWVIDFIGNGKSSRALVRKGRLHHVVRTSVAGQVFTVLDGNNEPVKNASLWIAGHAYQTGEDGRVTVPFSSNPSRQPIVLISGGFASLAHFDHESESYSLASGIYVDRESLLERREAEVVVRPELLLNGTPVTLSVLEEAELVITSTDLDGISTSKEIDDFELFEDRESSFIFQTPERLSSIRFTLKAKVERVASANADKLELAAAETFTLNQIDATDKVQDLHLANFDGSYVLELLGKSGEPLGDRAVNFELKHHDFTQTVHVSLRSDARGRIELGPLTGIDHLTATDPAGTSHTWHMAEDRHSRYPVRHGEAGGTLEFAYMGASDKPLRSELSLLELRGETFVADRFDAISIERGLIKIAGLPAGDYDLLLKESGRRIRIRLTQGKEQGDYVLGEARKLEVRGDKPLQIAAVTADDESVVITLQNNSSYARVHVFATRYLPAYSAYDTLHVGDVSPFLLIPPSAESLYVEGRNIGDEYRYIIDRRYAQKFPGVMLERPSLLLNPWAIRETSTAQQIAQGGDDFRSGGTGSEGQDGRGGEQLHGPQSLVDFSNLDFLSEEAVVLVNLVADEKGVITIPRDTLGSKQHIHVIAAAPGDTVYRSIALPEQETKFLDLRLTDGLDPEKHFTQQQQVSVLSAKDTLVLPDISSSRFEAYDNLARVYGLYATLTGDPKLIEFGFVLQWPTLEEQEKRSLYSKYACHELNFFLHQKDPEFFRDVVAPYLANKKDKTFLDRWLLEEDLADQLEPWSYHRLNVVEQILLARRLPGELEHTARDIRDLYSLLPPQPDRQSFLFDTAVKGTALDADDDFGFEEAKKMADHRQQGAESYAPGEKMPAGGVAGGAYPATPPPDADAPAREPAAPKPGRESKSEGRPGDDLERRSGRAREENQNAGKDKEGYYAEDRKARQNVRALYQRIDQTKEWVENNYYHLPLEQQNGDLVTVDGFWRDYATRDLESPFYSTHLADAAGNFTEMMFALSVLDLPFTAEQHETTFDDRRMTLVTAGPVIIYHEEILPAEAAGEEAPILVSQNFFRQDDRYRYEANDRLDKFVREEFLRHVVYGCQVVVTNPTSSPQKLDLLTQIPEGAMPVLSGKETRTTHLDLPAFSTQTLEFYFYFPAAGDFPHYPVQVAKDEKLIASAEPFTFHVVEEATRIDTTSWAWISQYGDEDDVIDYLTNHNLHRLNLEKIAFRMQDEAFFNRTLKLLARRRIYNDTLWSYGIKHDDLAAAREFLRHADSFLAQCGDYIDTRLITIDPVERVAYQHRDYKPLVNARAHRLGRERQILNDRLYGQYHDLLNILSYHRELGNEERMSVVYYLLLQDRVAEALVFFGGVNREELSEQLQYDYFAAHFDMRLGEVAEAREIAARYENHPVDRWREAFAALDQQLDELMGGPVELVNPDDRDLAQQRLAATAPSFDFNVEAKQVTIRYQRLGEVRVNYYLMDIELLFSSSPFVQQYGGEFSYIRPNRSETIKLPEDAAEQSFPLPKELHGSNVLIEISGGGQTSSQAYYAHSLTAQVIENYGQIRVAHGETGEPLPTTYVKVYARMQDGAVRFYKDGYTDLRGRFDYASLSTNELEFVEQFSILILSEEHGAVVREARPPKR